MSYSAEECLSRRSKDFSDRCVKIWNDLRGEYDHDTEYLRDSHIRDYPDGYMWVVQGRNFDICGKFNWEPSDQEICDAICGSFGMFKRRYHG